MKIFNSLGELGKEIFREMAVKYKNHSIDPERIIHGQRFFRVYETDLDFEDKTLKKISGKKLLEMLQGNIETKPLFVKYKLRR
jgi:hypothetical protein